MSSPSRSARRHGIGILLLVAALATEARAQGDSTTTPATTITPAATPTTTIGTRAPFYADISPDLVERNLSGPRLGVTFRADEDGNDDDDVGRLVSQFGWHFERQVAPNGGGPQFIMQFVPLVAAVEYGKFLPSGSLGLGVRFPSGYEFGIGPTASVREGQYGGVRLKSALFVAVGRSFDYGGVSIPVNVAVSTNQDGNNVSLIVGYAIQRAERALPHVQ